MDENETVFEVVRYAQPDGTEPLDRWLRELRNEKARKAIVRRLLRMEEGNFGDHKFERDGVWELRIDLGPGYRVYYALSGQRIVLLLCGGDKSSQARDLEQACTYWRESRRRSTS